MSLSLIQGPFAGAIEARGVNGLLQNVTFDNFYVPGSGVIGLKDANWTFDTVTFNLGQETGGYNSMS